MALSSPLIPTTEIRFQGEMADLFCPKFEYQAIAPTFQITDAIGVFSANFPDFVPYVRECQQSGAVFNVAIAPPTPTTVLESNRLVNGAMLAVFTVQGKRRSRFFRAATFEQDFQEFARQLDLVDEERLKYPIRAGSTITYAIAPSGSKRIIMPVLSIGIGLFTGNIPLAIGGALSLLRGVFARPITPEKEKENKETKSSYFSGGGSKNAGDNIVPRPYGTSVDANDRPIGGRLDCFYLSLNINNEPLEPEDDG